MLIKKKIFIRLILSNNIYKLNIMLIVNFVYKIISFYFISSIINNIICLYKYSLKNILYIIYISLFNNMNLLFKSYVLKYL